MLDSKLSLASPLLRAARWFLQSGIQQPSGGVSRYYLAESQSYKPVSTEITGYAASLFAWLFRITGDEAHLTAAQRAADFLLHDAWDPGLEIFAFEIPHRFSYFFDCGIIIRGLLAVWRATRDDRYVEIASRASHSMIRDFRAGRCYHPILSLPEKHPLAREARWSREPGCYQLKSALAWWEVAAITGDAELHATYEDALAIALASHREFLPGANDRHAVMDRLHAYCYFLEGLAAFLDRSECASACREGIDRASALLRDIAPDFARSDVYAQLLRARLLSARAIPLDREAASHEASEVALFQFSNNDPRLDGAWSFGRRNGQLSSHMNPVSTAFAMQALELWRAFNAGNTTLDEAPI
jgi:hypothetical protein